jgi:hypothetical protein
MELIITSEEKLRKIISSEIHKHLTNDQPTFSNHPIETATMPAMTYSIAELSEKVLKCSPVTTQKLKNSGKIKFRQFGRKCIFITSEVLEDIARLNKPKNRTKYEKAI